MQQNEANGGSDCYFVFMNYDPQYQRLRSHRTSEGDDELELYLSRKHEELLARWLQPGTYRKISSFLIVDGFSVEITETQANVLRSAEGVRVVEKNQEQPSIDAAESDTNGGSS